MEELPGRYDSLRGADEVYLYEDNSKQVVDYKQDRIVRLCTGNAPHGVPVRVRADQREVTLHAGDCVRVEAKQTWVEPNSHLPDLAMLKVDVETLNQ